MDGSNQNPESAVTLGTNYAEKSSKAPGTSESFFQYNLTCCCCRLKPRLWLKPLLDLRMFKRWKLLTHFSTFRDGQHHLSCRLINAACRWNPAKAIGKRLDTSTCAKRRKNRWWKSNWAKAMGKTKNKISRFRLEDDRFKGRSNAKKSTCHFAESSLKLFHVKQLEACPYSWSSTNRNRRNTPSWCSQPCCDLHHTNLLQAAKHDRLCTASFL